MNNYLPSSSARTDAGFTQLHVVVVFVRDQERSLRFYVDQLGFSVEIDHTLDSGRRWLEVTPPEGNARLALVTPDPGSNEEKRIGCFTWVFFLTADVNATFQEWQSRGVKFDSPPSQPVLGAMSTQFEDVDGNSFGLVGIDRATKEVEDRRRALAEKAEAERRAAQELEIAKQVQARLFPQTLPPMLKLDYCGVCLQARQVGGDYYDFLDLGGQRLGLVIGDISGKGIGAALLMANLQANLRSQCAIGADEPERLLRSANRMFYENTADSAYATLFFSEYDESQSRLAYVNCGHPPTLLFRSDGSLEYLDSTSTVLGLFKDWDCTIQSRQLHADDILVFYTDGVTESSNEAGEEFGSERLIEIVRRTHMLEAQGILSAIVDEAGKFCTSEQQDDITVIVAKRK